MQFVPTEKATTTREASTANFLIDSFDRETGNASDFTINPKQSIFNGFFTRISISEVGMNWGIPNISIYFENNEFGVEIGATQHLITLPDGNYTVASALTDIVAALNTAVGSTFFSLVGNYTDNQGVRLVGTSNFEVLNTNLQEQLTIQSGQVATSFFCQNPNLLAYRYVDFVCDNLTYNQALKDGSTSSTGQGQNVLYRWNFAWDAPAPIDSLGFPIYQGYQAFTARRNFAFPKQIRWEANMPIGQLRFQVLTEYNLPLVIEFPTAQFEWNMTTLISEV